VGRPPGVGVRPSSGGIGKPSKEINEKNELDPGFLGVLNFVWVFMKKRAIEPEETREREKGAPAL
jgi:hypothetical protein